MLGTAASTAENEKVSPNAFLPLLPDTVSTAQGIIKAHRNEILCCYASRFILHIQAESHDISRNTLYLLTPPKIKGLKTTQPDRMEQ